MAAVDRRPLPLMAALAAAYFASILMINPWGEFPLNDDWVYARDCIASSAAGRLVMTKYEAAWSLPQVVVCSAITRAVGFSHATFRLTGVVSLLASGVLLDLYLRRAGLGPTGRAIAFGTWLFNPVAYILGLSFMTDLPFVVLWLAACYGWDAALVEGRPGRIAWALGLTVLAMAQRQFALLIPLAAAWLVCCRWAARRRRGPATTGGPSTATAAALLIAAGLALATFWAISRWFSGQGGYRPPLVQETHPVSHYVLTASRVVGFFAISSAPLLLVMPGAPLAGGRRRLAQGLGVVAALAVVRILLRGRPVTFGNLLSEVGVFPDFIVLEGRRDVLLGPAWNGSIALIALLATLALLRLACSVRRDRLRDFLLGPSAEGPDPGGGDADARETAPFGGVILLASAMMLAIIMVRGIYFDRYFLPILPAVWVALARCRLAESPGRRAASAALVAASAIISTTVCSDLFRWNEARWSAAEKIERTGVAPRLIYGGYEWSGMKVGDKPSHSHNVLDYDYVVSFSGPIPGFREVERVPWVSIWPPHRRHLLVFEKETVPGR